MTSGWFTMLDFFVLEATPVWKMSTKTKSMLYLILQFDLGRENSGRIRSDAFSTGQSHVAHYIWSWGVG